MYAFLHPALAQTMDNSRSNYTCTEREGKGETDRQTERQRETDRQRQRETQTDRHRDRDTEKERKRDRDRQTCRQAGRQKVRHSLSAHLLRQRHLFCIFVYPLQT